MALDREALIALTADIVSAHVANNVVALGDMASVIAGVYGALEQLGAPPPSPPPEKPKGAVPVRGSVRPDRILSMIDGRPYKTLGRHIATHGYTPESYRDAFGLPRDYPMVSADYTETRRAMALRIGLGRRSEATTPAPAKPPRKPTAPKPKE